MASRAAWNVLAGRIWPADRSLETPGLGDKNIAYDFISWFQVFGAWTGVGL